MLHKTLLLMLTLCLLAVPAQAADKDISLELTLGDPESSEMGFLGNAFKKFVEARVPYRSALPTAAAWARTRAISSAGCRPASWIWPWAA